MYFWQSAHTTVEPPLLLVSMAYWSMAESMMRKSSRICVACERLRARRKFGTAIAASNAMIATTIMISTRVKPERDLNACFMGSKFNNYITIKSITKSQYHNNRQTAFLIRIASRNLLVVWTK